MTAKFKPFSFSPLWEKVGRESGSDEQAHRPMTGVAASRCRPGGGVQATPARPFANRVIQSGWLWGSFGLSFGIA